MSDHKQRFRAVSPQDGPAGWPELMELGGERGKGAGGAAGPMRESASATTLSLPDMCWTSVVASAMAASWRAWRPEAGSVALWSAARMGLWSV